MTLWRYLKEKAALLMQWPSIQHWQRAINRFNDRLGNQFGAAITYFSFLSLIPILMLLFAAVGFVLSRNTSLLTELIDDMVKAINDPTLAETLKNSVNTAIRQRTTVGMTGLLLALYSGVNWMSNLREAIRAQSRSVWENREGNDEHFYYRYLRDFALLLGLVTILLLTLALTSITGAAQKWIVLYLGLEHITGLRPLITITGLFLSICVNFLLFFWIFWQLPSQRPERKALLKGTLLASIGFEVIKTVMTYLLPRLTSSPSGAVFGSVLGLMAFFYFFARLTLFCAAWIATANQQSQQEAIDR